MVIRVENLSLCYRMTYDRVKSIKEYLVKTVKGKIKYEEFWALRDIAFEVKKGEVLGIIGHNGAGKSSLLKVISGILKPTQGTVMIHGSVVPMLELGSGFDYDLTGRENIFLNGAILGYSEEFLHAKYDEIVEFSELGQFVDVPLRNYSSGMVMRLAFSVATVLNPDILIVDEILAVGDADFQAKSKARMMELMSGGTTVLFVSHSIAQIREMCDRVLWLEHGKMRMLGRSKEVCDAYEGIDSVAVTAENDLYVPQKAACEESDERVGLSDYLKLMTELENFVWVLNNLPTYYPPKAALSAVADGDPEDGVLIRRIIEAYQSATGESPAGRTSFWDDMTTGIKGDIHESLISGDEEKLREQLRYPDTNRLFWGFDAICKSTPETPEPHELVLRRLNSRKRWEELYLRWIYDELISLAAVLGIQKLQYPEVDWNERIGTLTFPKDIDWLLDAMAATLGFNLQFPNPFPNEQGLASSRGVISMRALQSLYQAYRIAAIVKGSGAARVLEIGAGLGRTAYFCWEMGIRDYTIIDIPMTNVAQSYFLGRTIGESNIAMKLEEAGPEKIKILPEYALSATGPFDLVLNADSLAGMDLQTQHKYYAYIKENSTCFLSIDHEENPHTVRELTTGCGFVRRMTCPLRRGYLEEEVYFRSNSVLNP